MQRKMREILFRGKSIDLDKWVYGFYAGENCKYPWSPSIKQANIIQEGSGLWFEVAPETLGQYTGLTDKNSKKIFEGDIIKHYGKSLLGDPISDIGVVTWDCDECFLFRTSLSGKDQLMSRKDTVEVLGNIHDDPELVERESESNG